MLGKLVNVMSKIKWNVSWIYFLQEAAVCNKIVSMSNLRGHKEVIVTKEVLRIFKLIA